MNIEMKSKLKHNTRLIIYATTMPRGPRTAKRKSHHSSHVLQCLLLLLLLLFLLSSTSQLLQSHHSASAQTISLRQTEALTLNNANVEIVIRDDMVQTNFFDQEVQECACVMCDGCACVWCDVMRGMELCVG